ncbi:uncharacterized protein LOC108095886 [Drosophila ficusphila]|uniref:uncharacterized protein LOC108095886 n=1 Tax=Drosophila ficusphila TaxID=30025 RepID=UPI0007E87352|nr:uncharacterized protein LOC108095886 [Drosophila ficusphila]
MACSSYKNKTVQLIKCFCGCSDMTISEVRRIYTLSNSVHETLLDPEATRLLQKFMETRRSGDKNEAEQYLEIYEKCAEFLAEHQRTFTQDEVDELVDMGLPYDLEQDLSRRMLSADRTDINRGLYRIQGKCRNEIEASSDFRDFRDAIADKMRRVPK